MPITPSSFLRRAALPAVGLLAGSAFAVSAADGQTGRTLEFSGAAPAARELNEIDARPRGLSIGDQAVAAIMLRQDGGIAGRAHVRCTIIDRRYGGQDCDLVLVLRDGTITASGGGLHRLLPGQPSSPPHAPDVYAVTGGTGAYAAASGTLSMQDHDDDSSAITLSIQR
jgi:hypothetical protein